MDSEANIVSNLRVALKIQLCSSQERRHTLDVADFHLRQQNFLVSWLQQS